MIIYYIEYSRWFFLIFMTYYFPVRRTILCRSFVSYYFTKYFVAAKLAAQNKSKYGKTMATNTNIRLLYRQDQYQYQYTQLHY